MKTVIKLATSIIFFSLVLVLGRAAPVFAHSSPVGCTGSGLGISLFSNPTEVHIGDTIQYSVVVFNGSGFGPVVCDASGITAQITTPDGVSHPITLVRTALTNGQNDSYLNVVSYVAQAVHMNPVTGILAATASDIGTIHQNVADSSGGANQGLNVFVLGDLHIIKNVINDDGGTAVASNFNIHVKFSGTDVPGSPLPGTGSPGTLYELVAGSYTISEDPNAAYTQSFSGDCNPAGVVTLSGGVSETCTITNNDIPGAPIPTATPAASPPSSGPTSPPGGGPVCQTTGVFAVPVITSATRVSPTSVFLSWTSADTRTDFVVQYGFSNDNWQFSTHISGLSTTVNNLPANQAIWGRVASTDNCTVGTFTSPVLFGKIAARFPNTGSPRLPNTGGGSNDKSLSWNMVITAGLVILFLTTLAAISRRRRVS